MRAETAGQSDDRRAVSTVIAAVLMIAVVVVLASVVSLYLVSFGGDGEEPAPRMGASVEFDQRTTGNGQYLNLTYNAGKQLDTDRLAVRVEDARSLDPGGSTERAVYTGSVLVSQAGSSIGVGETVSIDREEFEEADGDPIAGSESLDLTDATVTIYWRGSDSSKPIFQWQR